MCAPVPIPGACRWSVADAVVADFDPAEFAVPDLGKIDSGPGAHELFVVGHEKRLRGGVIKANGAVAHGGSQRRPTIDCLQAREWSNTHPPRLDRAPP